MRKTLFFVLFVMLTGLACSLTIDSAEEAHEFAVEEQTKEFRNQLLECNQNAESVPVSDCINSLTTDPVLQDQLEDFYDCLYNSGADRDPFGEQGCMDDFMEQRIDTNHGLEPEAGGDDQDAPEEVEEPDEPAGQPENTDGEAEDDPEPPPETGGEGDVEAFCAVYETMVADLLERVEAYEAAIAAEEPAHEIAVEADHALEGFYDQMVGPAPNEIRANVEAVAAMSLIGLLSSPDGVPQAEPHLEAIDTYAAAHCAASLGGEN